ncbi:hypothetical protein PENSPDRAFT_670438 [Peniophora sp. CONT]|nr:hypothetical protein PENSPDRAFT_670438 [Peniophora sp. CONT]
MSQEQREFIASHLRGNILYGCRRGIRRSHGWQTVPGAISGGGGPCSYLARCYNLVLSTGPPTHENYRPRPFPPQNKTRVKPVAQVATMEDTDVNGKQIVWLREVSIDIVAANSGELDEDKISSCLWDAQREAEYIKISGVLSDIVELFEEGVFERLKRLTISKDDVFVKFMPSSAYDFVKTVQSQVWGTVKKQADGTIFPESYLELENYCTSVIVEIGSSENSSERIVDKEWWLNFAKHSVHGKVSRYLPLRPMFRLTRE